MIGKQCLAVCAALLCALSALSGCIKINVPADAAQATAQPAQAPLATAVPAPTEQPALSPGPTPVPTPDPAPSAQPVLTPNPAGATENKLGYVIKAYSIGEVNYIDIDYVDLYMGQEAIEKALEDGSDAVYKYNGEYTIDNDYYLRNNNPKIRTFAVDPSCPFELVDMGDSGGGGIQYKTVSFDAFALAVRDADNIRYLIHVDIQGDILISSEEQYLP